MLYKIVWGDRSGDGHSMTDSARIKILSPHGLDDIRAAYVANCSSWGISLAEIGQDYEDSSIDNLVIYKMIESGVDVEKFSECYDGKYSVYSPADLAMTFMSHGIEGFEYEEVEDDAICLVGSYNSKVESESYGYGFLYT